MWPHADKGLQTQIFFQMLLVKNSFKQKNKASMSASQTFWFKQPFAESHQQADTLLQIRII